MDNKLLRVVLVSAFVFLLCAGLFGAGFVAGHTTAVGRFAFAPVTGGSAVPADHSTGVGAPSEVADQFAPFWEAWSLVHQEYVDQPVDDQALAYGAIKGMLEALGDKHTGYSTPDESEILFSDASGELEGIGAEVAAKGDYVEIISPMPGSPAEAAGILPGDLIAGVDGEDTTGQDLFTVIGKVRGPAGTKVRLEVIREGEPEPLEFEITRAKITIPSVESKMLEGQIGYVKINSFGDNTVRELRTQLKALMDQTPAGVVLDLRGNPGGYRDAAIAVASQFVGEGTVMIQRYGDGRQEVFEASKGGLATDVPLAVLINHGSASASEIVAGAIQDHDRGTIVGEQSYGKGTVQDWRPLSNDQGSVRITIARWLTPDERSIDKVGIAPDVEVEMTADDRTADRDPQLEAAVRILSGEVVAESK
ncbi:MAG: S41 family peptidase [Chloroflexi bacterium]|nr:S41 family peptidase [Chloroflexota bacterium]